MKRKDREYWNSISSPYDGGRYVDYRGYVHFRFIDESGKKVDKLEHRMNMEYTLCRKLFTTEMVHHINGRASDNREENLILMTRRQHSPYTQRHIRGKPGYGLDKWEKYDILFLFPRGLLKNE